MLRRRIICLLAALVLVCCDIIPALALDASTLKHGSRGEQVRAVQEALITLGYLKGKADGIFGNKTENAVRKFQRKNKLKVDGLVGKKTMALLLELAAKKKSSVKPTPTPDPTPTPTPTPTPDPEQPSSPVAPDGSRIRLLHWFNDVKGTLNNGDHLLIYDPETRISWTLRVYSRGRHCDSEPLTLADTQNMVKAFGGKNTWNQKGVYVRLPSGVWTIGSTHDMPHLSGSIPDNGFNGHLCVHFLRDMAEAKKNDPNYGVANQETIRKLWKSLTGEEIKN